MNRRGFVRFATRAVRTAFAAVAAVGLAAGPADAHSASNTPASNYVSRVVSITPKPAGWSAKVIEAGNRLQVSWKSGAELSIPDYDGHPYLRVGPDGVFENTQSNATYLNADRQGATTIPDGLNPEGPPTWRRISTGHVARFHDHRIHWMGSAPPSQVQRDRGRVHKIEDWEVPLTQGSENFTIRGDKRWVPGPSPVLPLALAGAIGLVGAAASVVLARKRGLRAGFAPFAAMLLGLVVVDAIHLFGIAFGVQGGSGFLRALGIGWASVLAWVLAIGSLVMLARKRHDALYVCVFAAGIITLVGGLSDLSVLSSSSVPYAYGVGLARIAIALTLGLGVGVVIAGVFLTGIREPVAEGPDNVPDQASDQGSSAAHPSAVDDSPSAS